MRKLIICLLFGFILLATSTFAQLNNTNVYIAYTMENGVAIDAANGYNGTSTGIINNATIYKGGSRSSQGDGNANSFTNNTNIGFMDNSGDSYTISLWTNGTWVDGKVIYEGFDAVDTRLRMLHEVNAGAKGVRMFSANSVGTNDCLINYNGWVDGVWQHWVYVFDNENNSGRMYLNGVNVANDTSCSDSDTITEWRTHNDRNLGNHYAGFIDEFYIFNTSLNHVTITELYNSGSGKFYSFESSNFTITAVNNETSATISSFNATITGDSFYSTAVGTITTNININSTSLWNITVCAEDYVCSTYNLYNVSSNLQARLVPTISTTSSIIPNVLSGQSSKFLLNITYNAGVPDNISASIFYNYTKYSMTNLGAVGGTYQFSRNITAPILTNDFNSSVIFEYMVNGVKTNLTQVNQSIYPVKMDNCTLYSTIWVNYSLRDEETNALVNDDTEYLFELSYNAYSFQYNHSQTGSNHYEFCYYPAWASITADITLQYTAVGYDSRDYIVNNFRVDNITDQINLYLLNTSSSTAITVHVIDDSDADLSGVLVEAYKYDIATDSDLLVETETTDTNGNVQFELQTGSTYYSFKFYQGGELKLSTTRFKLISTSYEYVITGGIINPLGEKISINANLIHSLTYDKTTDIVNFTWNYSGTRVNLFCLNVSGNGTDFFDGCSSSYSGSLSYKLLAYNITYTAVSSAVTDLQSYVLDIKDIDKRLVITVFEDQGLLLSIFIYLTIALLGLMYKNAGIILSCFAVIALSLFGFLPLGLSGTIGVVALGILALILINRRGNP